MIGKEKFHEPSEVMITRLMINRVKDGVFWVNIVKFKVNLRYMNCSKIIGKLRRETEFRQWHCRNSAKKQERE